MALASLVLFVGLLQATFTYQNAINRYYLEVWLDLRGAKFWGAIDQATKGADDSRSFVALRLLGGGYRERYLAYVSDGEESTVRLVFGKDSELFAHEPKNLGVLSTVYIMNDGYEFFVPSQQKRRACDYKLESATVIDIPPCLAILLYPKDARSLVLTPIKRNFFIISSPNEKERI